MHMAEGQFCGGNDAWNNIKGKYFFNALATVVHNKGDAPAHKKAFSQFFFFIEFFNLELLHKLNCLFVLFSDGCTGVQLIPGIDIY